MHCNCETRDGWSARKIGGCVFLEVAPAVHIGSCSGNPELSLEHYAVNMTEKKVLLAPLRRQRD
jgi:hypothetical protein